MSTHEHPALPELGQLQDLLLDTDTLDTFLRESTTGAAGNAERTLSCGVTVYTSRRRPYTLASSDEMASRLDQAQYEARGGPFLYALTNGVPVNPTSLDDAARWPDYQRQAAVEGMSSSLSVPLSADRSHHHEPVGALNLYARGRTLADDEQQQAHAFAERVAGAVTLAARMAEQHRLTEDLEAAMASRTTINQALGVLMGQQRCTAEQAFDLLRQASQRRNIKLHHVAAELITQVSGQSPQPEPFHT